MTAISDEELADFTDPEPHDQPAEQAVLGAMMLSEASAQGCRQALNPGDFYEPRHQTIFSAIITAMRESLPTDALTIKDRLEAGGELARIGGPTYLHTLLAAVPVAANGLHWAHIIREHSVVRQTRTTARRTLQRTRQGAGLDGAYGLVEQVLRDFEAIRNAGTGDGLTVQTITEFLDVDEDEDGYDWVIEGLLERGDRLMLTGIEGAGKSTLFRQLAVMAAAGLHPFTGAEIKPARALILDFENSARHARRKIRPLVTQARLQGHEVDEANLWIECRPQGIDLMLDQDLSWMLRQVAAVQPDITFLGPLKSMAPRALHTDDEAAPIVAAFNMIRARGSAVVLEAHAGHAIGAGGKRDMRPRGSSAFLGWPEFGYGIRWADEETAEQERTVNFISWRGDRDEREWPQMLTAGGTWPWRVCDGPAKGGWGSQ